MTADLAARGLKLLHLRLLAELGAEGGLGAAAGRLGITQPAASRLLAEAARIAGRPLHRRDGRGIGLTVEGAALALRARRALAELGAAPRDMAEAGEGRVGSVRIGAVTGAALDRVLPALRTARLALPGIAAEVEVATSEALGPMVLDGRLDFAFCRLPAGRDPGLFDLRPLAAEPVRLVVRRDHALAGRQAGRDELLAHDWVLPGPGAVLRDAVLDRLAHLGLPPPMGRLMTSSFLFTLAWLGQSNAIAPMSAAVADRFATGEAAFATVGDDLDIAVVPYGFVTRAGARLTPSAARIAALMIG